MNDLEMELQIIDKVLLNGLFSQQGSGFELNNPNHEDANYIVWQLPHLGNVQQQADHSFKDDS